MAEEAKTTEGLKQKESSRELLVKLLENYPDEWDRAFELGLMRLVNTGAVNEEELLRIADDFGETRGASLSAEERENEERVAYAAVFCLNILYRHALDTRKFRALYERHKDWCQAHNTFRYVVIMFRMHIPEELAGNEEEFLQDLDKVSRTYPKNSGFAHAVANLYAEVCEKDQALRESLRRKWGKKARQAVERAIRLEPDYALFYCTKGRIALIDNDYSETDDLFEKAIHLEDSSNKGYALRVGRYQSYKQQARIMKAIASTDIQEQIDALKHASVSNIEVLSFFAAIISFLLGGLSIAKEYPVAEEAAGLMIVLMGALLCAFGAFSFLLRFSVSRKWTHNVPYLAVSLLGAGVLMLGWLLLPHGI